MNKAHSVISRFTGLAAAGLLALGVGQASANVISGDVWFVSTAVATNAIPSNVPATTPDVTFDVPSTPLNLNSGNLYTIGQFLASGGAYNITYNNGHTGSNSLFNTLFDFKGSVTVTTGDTFVAGHDDGLTLTIGGLTVISEPGPTGFTTTTRTYTGPTGNFPFELVYGECCGAPANLRVTLSLSNGVPEPATLALLGLGVAGLGFSGRKQA